MQYVTDTGGNPIKRLGAASIRRVLDDPVNVTSAAACDYAVCYYEPLGLTLLVQYMHGRCHYEVIREGCDADVFTVSKRDQAIRWFLELVTAHQNGQPVDELQSPIVRELTNNRQLNLCCV